MNRILLTGARAPVALHMARLLAADGHEIVLADSVRFPLADATRFKTAYVRLPSPRYNLAAYAQAVSEACQAHHIDLIVPTCEEVFHLAAVRAHIIPDLPLFAPNLDLLALAHNKADFVDMARGFGADPPETHRLTHVLDLEPFRAVSQDWVFKPAWSRFASRVIIRPTQYELSRLDHLLGNPWVAQAWLPGEELCCYAVAHHGELVALSAYRPLWRAGLGAGIAIEPAYDEAIAGFVRNFTAFHGWHGQISFDFRRDAEGALHVIECNPRATTGVNVFAAADHLPAAIIGGTHTTPSRDRPQTVPLAMMLYGFAQAFREGRLKAWCQDFARMEDMLADKRDRSVWPYTLLSFAEIAGTALRHRQSLTTASTHDIEWNGEPFL